MKSDVDLLTQNEAVSNGFFSDTVPLRPPEMVCRMERMGAAFPTRLSFMRLLLRRMKQEMWKIQRVRFDLDDSGYGRAVYEVHTPDRQYSLAAFANPLADHQRTDRVIASAWDAAFVLFDGKPTQGDLERLADNAPHQEAGRFEATDLVISRANRSMRLFEYVCGCLAKGDQPDADKLLEVGYLMRTTAVYGNGKFGISDRSRINWREEARNSFQIEMLTVYLIRLFTVDQLDHIAKCRAPDKAVKLKPELKRALGIGNATGLGMAPFVVSHPELFHEWFHARETALARVRALDLVSQESIDRATALAQRVLGHLEQWHSGDLEYQSRNQRLGEDLKTLLSWLSDGSASGIRERFWDDTVRKSETAFGVDAQELLVALLIETYPECVEDLEKSFHSSETRRIDVAMTVAEFREQFDKQYAWVDQYDFSTDAENTHFWYVSENKLEPRFGRRREEPGADKEMPVAIARDMSALKGGLAAFDQAASLAEFLIAHPEFRHLVRRAQSLSDLPYGEIQDNLIADGTSPLDILRFKLANFGAAKFDPKSALWTRITMFQGAPLPEDLDGDLTDDWWLPTLP
ncbi:MAG: hypothetical protein L7U43_07270 [Arenicellales bacterium]|nr:hypothetical protein [Arenicellales bacterium]